MNICTIPPAGWSCSREPGHEGPCAASCAFPYDEYADKVLSNLRFHATLRFVDGVPLEPKDGDWNRSISKRELRSMLTNAWMDGLKYSLVMIESEKRNRDTKEA